LTKETQKIQTHHQILNELVKLYGFSISESGVSISGRGIDARAGGETGIEVKTFPKPWQEQLERYKKEYGFKKIILLLEVPQVVDEVYIYKPSEIARKVEKAISTVKKFLDWVVETAYSMTKREIESNLKREISEK